MPTIAIIGGSGFNQAKWLKGFKQNIVKTMYGNVLLYRKGKVIFLPRHGKNMAIPPHRINHRANICALNLQGVEKIFAINSVGSLKVNIKPGTFLMPDDYIHFTPESFFEFEMKSIVPEINEKIRKELKQAAKKAKVTVKPKAIYMQTKGPRFETKAEINIIKKWADILGMTMGSEANLAQELGIPYACLCAVDNYAHGIGKKLDINSIIKMHKKNMPKSEKILKEIVKANKDVNSN